MGNDDLRGHLMAIYKKYGQLTPELVVKIARKPTHRLHTEVFDRPPELAAEAWYRHRAHELIQEVRVVYQPTPESEHRKVRAFHCVRAEDGFLYEPVEKVVGDPFLRSLVLRDMEREWKQLQRRYGEFEEFVQMVLGDLGEEAA